MITGNTIARFAMSAMLFAMLTPHGMRAQQADTADPNLPGVASPPGLRVQWSYTTPVPQVILLHTAGMPNEGAPQGAVYMGWNEEGSWLVGTIDSEVYVWNLKANSLTPRYQRDIDIPQTTLATIRNFTGLTHMWSDPNLPGITDQLYTVGINHGVTVDLNVEWSNYNSVPSVIIRTPEFLPQQPPRSLSSGGAGYLGWDDQGSWLVQDGLIFVWNLKENRVREIYKNYNDIPKDVLASLKNNPRTAAKNYVAPKPAEGPHPQTPDTSRQAALFGGARKLSQAAPPGAITGTGAAIEGGVLTFTRADKSKASYKVMRPKIMQNAPKASGIAGTWIAVEASGGGIIFTVLGDGSLTGREMPAQVIQMLTQASARN
jgi:hypothetical protein